MTSQPSRQLTDAAAALAPADRALLNLWIHRGLGDDRLAELTGMSVATVRARRERVVSELAGQLGRPAADVLAALRALEPGSEGTWPPPYVTATAGGLEAPATTSTAGAPKPAADLLPRSGSRWAAEPDDETQAEPEDHSPTSEAAPEAAASSSRRGRWWAALTGAIAIAVAAVLVMLLAGGSPSRSPTADTGAISVASESSTTKAASPSAASRPGPTPSTGAQTTPTSSTAPSGALRRLPGGLTHVSGVVRLIGKVRHLRLRLTVKGLPLVHHAHYEAWLYNSVSDARALGHVTRDVANTYRLPRGARHYRYVDVSVQPKHSVSHSGESRVRAANPVHGPKDIIRRMRARRPRRLSVAAGRRHAGAAHQPKKKQTMRASHRRHRTAKARHAGRTRRHHHPQRRRGRRSRKGSASK